MELPQNLTAWTYSTILAAVRLYEYEPAQLDFKEVLHTTEKKDQRKHNENLQKCVVSMANAPGGGCIIFGVRDPRADNGAAILLPEGRIVGIPLGADLRKELGEKLSAIQPRPSFDVQVIPLPDNPSRGVLVAAIPESPLRPHMDPSTHAFYKRGAGGSAEPMDQHEVRDQMLYSVQRFQQIRLLRLELRTYRRLITVLRLDATGWFIHLDTDAFKTMLANVCDLLPADGILLENLHLAATLAGSVNDAIRAGYNIWLNKTPTVLKGIPGYSRRILDNLRSQGEKPLDEFDRICSECEQALEALFGSLSDTNEMREVENDAQPNVAVPKGESDEQ